MPKRGGCTAVATPTPSTLTTAAIDDSPVVSGNTIFVVAECYETPAGIARHWQDTTENWPEMSSAAQAWFAKATIVTLHNGSVVQALW